MLLNSGKTSRDGVEILSKTTFESMVTATSVANGGNLLMGYGKGWARRTHQGHGVSFSGVVTVSDFPSNFHPASLLLMTVAAQEFRVTLGSFLVTDLVLSSLRMLANEIMSAAR